MKTLLLLLLLGSLGAATATAEENREGTGVYTPDPGVEAPVTTGPVAAVPVPVPSDPPALDEARRLRARRLDVLNEAVRLSADPAERDRLEEEMLLIKLAGEKDDLRLLMQAAEADGFEARAAELRTALRELETPRAPVAPGATVPRDPADGRALEGAAKGGVR